MKIVDKRESTKQLPVVEVLDEIVPLFRKQHFLGIRNLVLMDKDYRKGGKAAGRYCKIKGSNRADIEMFFSHLAELPPDVRESRMYLTFRVMSTLMHEIYHHIVRGQKRLKKRSDKREEQDAAKWSDGAVRHAFPKLYPREQHESEWKRINMILDDDSQLAAQQKAGGDSASRNATA